MRTIIVVAWRMLDRRSNELCAALGVSQPAASNILTRATRKQLCEARKLLERIGAVK
jgi:hypothetical protein